MSKQDRQGVRTAADLERKYKFDSDYSEVVNLATSAQRNASAAAMTANNAFDKAKEAEKSASSAAAGMESLDRRLTNIEENGIHGEDGATFTPKIENFTLSWENDKGLDNPDPVYIRGAKGEKGDQGHQGNPGANGEDGATYTPQISDDGTLSWTNDRGLINPPSINFYTGIDEKVELHIEALDPDVVVRNAGGIVDYVEQELANFECGGGDMRQDDYDPDGEVRELGGIEAYVDERLAAFEGGTIEGGTIDGNLEVSGDVSVEGEVTATAVSAETIYGLNDAVNSNEAVPLGQMEKYVAQELANFEGGVSAEELDKKLDKTGGTLTGDLNVGSADINVENGNIGVSDLFFDSTAINAGNIKISTGEGTVTLSPIDGLTFEDTEGNKKTIGGIGYITEPDPNAVMFSEMEEYVEEAISASDLCVNMVNTDIPSDDPEMIIVEADKTYAQVLEAYNSGKSVCAKYMMDDTDTFILPLIGVLDGVALFLLYTGTETLQIAMMDGMENYAAAYITSAFDQLPIDDHTIIRDGHGRLAVNTADKVGDNTLPITAAAVNTTVGNIEVLLKTI